MKNTILLFSMLFFLVVAAKAQQAQAAKPYKYVIKGGHVIDPKSNINGVMDIAITEGVQGRPAVTARAAQGNQPARAAQPAVPAVDGKIALVARNIDPDLCVQVIDATGLYVTPGLIDLHVHFFYGHDGQAYKNGPNGLPPDGFTFRSGVTTVVDAGSSGWRDFETFKKQTIDPSLTRVLALLNIVGTGMGGNESNIPEMDVEKATEMAKKYPNHIVGVKTAHFSGQRGWTQIDRSIAVGKNVNIPIMVDFGSATPYLPLDSLFNVKFRPGDIYTHAFGGNPEVGETRPGGREAIVDTKGNVKPYVKRAQQRGVIFDVGFGGSSFLLSEGLPATKAGWYPNSISTDLHTSSMNNAMKDMPNIMSLFMAMGMDLQTVIRLSTWNPATIIKRPELGNLSVGSPADVAIFNLRDGKFGFYARDGKIAGTRRLETEMTIRGGNVVYNLNGRIEPLNPPAAPAQAQQRPAVANPQVPR